MQKALELIKNGYLHEAEQEFQAYIATNENDPIAYKELGRLYLDTRRFPLALECFSNAIGLDDSDAQVYNIQGIAYKSVFRFHDALQSFQRAINIDPQYAAAHANYITVLERLNKIPEARAALDHAKVVLEQQTLLTLIEAEVLKRENKYAQAIDVLENGILADDPVTIVSAKSELVSLYDKTRNTSKAWQALEDRNRYAQDIWSIDDNRKAVYLNKLKALDNTFNEDFIASWDTQSVPRHNEPPVFMFSFARSGTTLLQHILDAHPNIHVSEEIHTLPRIAEIIEQQVGNYPACLPHLTAAQIAQLQGLHFDIHRNEGGWDSKKILIDKYPMNTVNAGLIYRIFPDAKFIFSYRHPCDCILSSCMNLFEDNEAMIHTYSMEDTVNLYCRVMDLWERYERILPVPVLYVSYEEIIGDFKPALVRVLDFLSEEWDDSLSNYYKNVQKKEVIRTPSYSQVSQDIYTDSQYRWERYYEHFEPFLEKLAPYIQKLGYEDPLKR